jgi:hypothetical protein
MRKILLLSLFLLMAIFLTCAGCTQVQQNSGAPTSQPTPSPTDLITIVTTIPTAEPATISTPAPTPLGPGERDITDGFWCRDTTMNIGTAPTKITECYQFFSDGTFKWGYSPGWPMGKSKSCSAPNVVCKYSLNSNGKYEVQGGYFYTLSGDLLIDPHDTPYFAWSSKGIP